MAENMDENEIKGVAEAMEELRRTGTLSAESLSKLSGSSEASKKALEGFSKQILGVGKAVGGMASTLANGQGSFASMGSTIEATTKVMGNLLSAIPLVGGAMKAMADGVGAAADFVLKQLDTMATNYQTLGDASAGAVDGLDGLYRQFNAMGNYSLPAFTKAIKANTVGMAAFRGAASEGAEEFSIIAGKLTKGDIGERFLRLGMSLDGVGDAAASYISTSSRYGIIQGNTTEELTKKTQNYIEEVDKIARMTGQSREQQQQESQKSLLNIRFRAHLMEMTDAGMEKQAEQLRMYAEGLGGPAGDAVRAWATGIPATKEGAAASLLMNGAIQENVEAINNNKTATQAISDTMVAGAQGAKTFGANMAYMGDIAGGAAGQMMDYREIVEQATKEGKTVEQVAKERQKKQADASGALTKDFTAAQMAVANSSKNIQTLGFTLAILAVPAVETFAEGLNDLTDFINDHFGNIAGSKKENAQNEENWNNMKVGSKVLHGMSIGLEKIAGAIGVDTTNARKSRMESETKEFGTNKVVGSEDARSKAEGYYGKKISDEEYSALVKATHAEAGAGKGASQKEQAMIMASILNRARTDQGGIIGALTAKNQFQSVTGTAADGHQPSKQFLTGPDKDRLKSIEGATDYLDKISKEQKNFTAASAAAYGPGTNIGYRDEMLAGGGQVIGGSVFQTGMPTGSKSNANDKTTPASDSYKNQLSDLNKEAQAARDKLAATTAGPLTGYQSQLSGLNPSKTLPEKTEASDQAAKNLSAAVSDQHIDLLDRMNNTLARMLSSTEATAAHTKKSVQLQS